MNNASMYHLLAAALLTCAGCASCAESAVSTDVVVDAGETPVTDPTLPEEQRWLSDPEVWQPIAVDTAGKTDCSSYELVASAERFPALQWSPVGSGWESARTAYGAGQTTLLGLSTAAAPDGQARPLLSTTQEISASGGRSYVVQRLIALDAGKTIGAMEVVQTENAHTWQLCRMTASFESARTIGLTRNSAVSMLGSYDLATGSIRWRAPLIPNEGWAGRTADFGADDDALFLVASGGIWLGADPSSSKLRYLRDGIGNMPAGSGDLAAWSEYAGCTAVVHVYRLSTGTFIDLPPTNDGSMIIGAGPRGFAGSAGSFDQTCSPRSNRLSFWKFENDTLVQTVGPELASPGRNPSISSVATWGDFVVGFVSSIEQPNVYGYWLAVAQLPDLAFHRVDLPADCNPWALAVTDRFVYVVGTAPDRVPADVVYRFDLATLPPAGN